MGNSEQKKSTPKFSRTPSKLQQFLLQQNITQEQIAARTFQSVRTVSQICRNGQGSKSSKELIRLHLGLPKTKFYELLGQLIPTVKL